MGFHAKVDVYSVIYVTYIPKVLVEGESFTIKAEKFGYKSIEYI